MGKFNAALKSMRLRTLPLSLSGVVLGILLAYADYRVDWKVALLVMLTCVSLQILSNLSNELGDVLHGTDTAERVGPSYGLNSGALSIGFMKGLIAGAVVACLVFGGLMIWQSYGTLLALEPVCLMMLGVAAISAAMKYTLGRNPYGYRGLGDIYVFLFFGIVSVLGSYFVAAHTISSWILLLPASGIGLLSVGVLNINNIRDMETDAANRKTVALRLGLRGARIYQTILTVLGCICLLAYCAFRFFDIWHYLFVLLIPLYVPVLSMVWTRTGKELDRALPMHVIVTFLTALAMGLGYIIYLF